MSRTALRRLRGLCAASLVLALALMARAALTQSPPAGSQQPAQRKGAAAARPATADTVVATVGPARVSRAEFESRYRQQRQQYEARAGSELPAELVPIARRQVLEGLIQRELFQLEAERRGMLPSEREVEEEMKRDPFFHDGGMFNPQKFEALKTTQSQQFREVLRQLRLRMGARRLQDKLNRDLAPPEAELKAEAERELDRAAISYLALRHTEFAGRDPEPREADVLAEYRARSASLMLPERARLTIAFLNTPAPTEAERADPAALRAWTDRMRAQAEAALAEVRGGKSLEDATAAFGTPRRDIVVTRDNFPGYWRGDERLNDRLFSHAPGGVLPEPVPADRGWLLVRLEERTAARVAPLSEVAPRIRADLRERLRRRAEDEALRPTYERMKESLRATAYRVRYAVAETARVRLREPSSADLERYYRAHLADYSVFDPATTSVKARPFAEVQAEVRERWMRERRVETAREIVAGIAAAWGRGKRDRAAEARATLLRDVGPVVPGTPADTGAAGRAVGDSLARRSGALGVGAGLSPRGPMVFHVYESIPDHLPTFEQARARVAAQREQERAAEEEQGARALYDRDPARFAGGKVMKLTRVIVHPPDILDVRLTREEVERYHQEHMDRYSAPEMVRARHILIDPGAPGPEADEKARARALDLLRRIRAGEDFATLARQYSDDPPTRDAGGELGEFARGAMLEEFERAAFSLREGEVSEPVRTREGYHIIQCVSRQPAVAQPLTWMYGNVAGDLALERSERIARTRADSLYLVAGTSAKMLAAARKLGLEIMPMEHTVGDRRGLPHLVEVLRTLESMKPGQMYPGPHKGQGKDFAFSWADSFVTPPTPAWADARTRAIEAYRVGEGRRALESKMAEMDSLERRGFGFDSLGALWGGLEQVPELARGQGLPALEGGDTVDSLVFGTTPGRSLARGEVSGWLSLPRAVARVRLDQRTTPDAVAVASRVDNRRRAILERRMFEYVQELKKRHPVTIRDRELRNVGLPEPPQP